MFTCWVGIIDRESDSLFTYRPSDSWSKFYDPDFIPMFAPTFTDPALEEQANMICKGNSFCLFDIAVTKRVEIGAATMQGMQIRDTAIDMSKPSK